MFPNCIRAAAVLVVLTIALEAPADEMDFGYFVGTVKVEWVRGAARERKMRLLEDFAYVDPKGRTWLAPKGYETDGATIPQFLWTPVGGPYEGQYREAAVIHDVYCDKETDPHQDVHRMFYYATRATGVSWFHAKVLYGGVIFGGPKWSTGPSNCYAACHASPTVAAIETRPNEMSPEELSAFSEWVRKNNPSLDEIDTYIVKLRPPEHPDG